MSFRGPVVLAILDGWGVAPPSRGNAVTLAKTPVVSGWDAQYPHTTLQASGVAVGLSPDQDGNSEAGHMNLGAGRIVAQENVRISQSINDGTFFRNPAFLTAIHHVRKHHSTLHIMGMLGSAESAHADPDHLLALLMLAQNERLQHVRLHLFTDGRDSPRNFALEMLQKLYPHLGDARVATIMGRMYGMDRNKNWHRTELAYNAIARGLADHHVNEPLDAIAQAYARGESDEFILPTVVGDYQGVNDGDAMIFFNLRSDRARQIAKAFVQPNFEEQNVATKPFHRAKVLHDFTFVAMTDFGPDLPEMVTAYPAILLTHTLPVVMGDLRQLYIAESEKYAHVTYFFNGGFADPVAGERRMMVPSPDVQCYDTTPAMSSEKLTTIVVEALNGQQYDFIVMNFANTDMVGHTGNLPAGIQAMEAADACLGKIAAAVLAHEGALFVTGDHGNLEEMINLDAHKVDTEHSTNPVPFYIISHAWPRLKLRSDGVLGDVAPTILALMGRAQPPEMTGHSVVIA